LTKLIISKDITAQKHNFTVHKDNH